MGSAGFRLFAVLVFGSVVGGCSQSPAPVRAPDVSVVGQFSDATGFISAMLIGRAPSTELCAVRDTDRAENLEGACWPISDATALRTHRDDLVSFIDVEEGSGDAPPLYIAVGPAEVTVSLPCGSLASSSAAIPGNAALRAYFGSVTDRSDCEDTLQFLFERGGRRQVVGTG